MAGIMKRLTQALALWFISGTLVAKTYAAAPKGHFLLVGGGKVGPEVRREFIRLAGGKNARIVVIPSASNTARPAAAAAVWQGFHTRVAVLHAGDRQAAADPHLYSCLDRATGVWIGGGKQSRLVYLFGETPLADKLRAVLARGGVVGGTSAGASVVTRVMVLRNAEGHGLGLLEDYIIDQHFSQRHRLARLKKLIEKYKDKTGYGIDEGTALVISGDSVKVIGPGTVTRYQASGATAVLRARN
jgi:cyanophycinase